MATLGDIRFRLTKLAPGIDLDLLDGWIGDRYSQALDYLPWQRLDASGSLVTQAEYAAGTLTATQGSNAITGDGTVWTAGMTGRLIRIAGRTEYYTFTRTGDTTGTLDRAYEGETNSGLSYRIAQNLYALPADLRLLDSVSRLGGNVQLAKKSKAELRRMAPSKPVHGQPLYYALAMDSDSDPPQPRIELYPIPVEAEGLEFDYTADAAVPSTAGGSLLPFMRPAILLAGVQADLAMRAGNFSAADRFEARFQQLLSTAAGIDSDNNGPTRLRMPSRHTRHRVRRWTR